jgi:DnaJ homolog subfamily A member 2
MVKDNKLYDILEVESTATDTEIKKSYNRLSKLWHPDKHIDETKKKEVTIKFQEINQAKTILLDNEKRKVYDQIGMDIFKYDSDNGDQDGGHDPYSDFGNMFGGAFPFGMGGSSRFSGGMNSGPQRNVQEHIVEQVEVTLEDIICQKTINVNYKQKVECTKCCGEGTKNKKKSKCETCDGHGKQVRVSRMGQMIQQVVIQCSNCEGKGTYIEQTNKCDNCDAKGFIVKNKSIQVQLNIDVLFGQDAVFEGKGHQIKNMRTHLIIKIKELPNKVFKRINEDLYMEMELQLFQALCGFNKVVTHLDGRKLHISCSGKTDFNTIRKITGEGIANPEGKKGDLYIRFSINLPTLTSLSGDTKTQFKTLLQSFDKAEVLNEADVIKTTGLVKTICSDLKQNQSDKISQLLDQLKNTRSKSNPNPNMRDFGMESENNGHTQCAQQ